MVSSITGWMVVATWLGYLLQLTGWLPWWIPAAIVWLSFILLWSGLGTGAKKQAASLMLVGLAALGTAAWHGIYMPWREILAVNMPLLAMFVAVSFLSLAAPSDPDPKMPMGAKALWQTSLGMHLLGAVINLSVLFIFGDRLQRQGKLTEMQQIVVARSFCAAAWWSPFFVATGVALTYSPGMHWQSTVWPGLVMAMVALSFTYLDMLRKPEKEQFEGYPIRFESLVMPFLLAAVVMVSHSLWPDVSVLALICIFSPLGALLFMSDRPGGKAVLDFVQNKLSNIGNQFALFMAAGVFSSGIKAMVLVYPELFDLQKFSLDGPLYFAICGVMILVGMLGVHPVVSIAVVSPLLLPLHPDPNQLAFLFVTTWAISTASSPLSGFGLALVSRYQAAPVGILRNNWYYALIMWLLSSALSVLIF